MPWPSSRRRILVLGAGGRDFHTFNVCYRDDDGVEVVAFTATQIPGIDDRAYPASLAGPAYPDGIPIVPEAQLEDLVERLGVDEVVFAYSDVSHEHVMHLASRSLAAGAAFSLPGPDRSMLRSSRPVVAVGATRTGAGKSQVSRHVGRLLRAAGHRVALIRHPMPYGDLVAQRVQRFGTVADVDAASPTIEEREEYEAPVVEGFTVWAGVDYAAVLAAAEAEADVVVWDGGNNDLPFVRPDLHLVVADPLRPDDGLRYHPGEANLRMADAVVVNKVDESDPDVLAGVAAIERQVAAVDPAVPVLRAASRVRLDAGPPLAGLAVVVVEDGPTTTHGGLRHGAGFVAAREAGARVVDPRPYAVGALRETYERYPHLVAVVPAMGYGDDQRRDLERTLRAVPCDAVVAGTPVDLARLVDTGHPVRRARYDLEELGPVRLGDLLARVGLLEPEG